MRTPPSVMTQTNPRGSHLGMCPQVVLSRSVHVRLHPRKPGRVGHVERPEQRPTLESDHSIDPSVGLQAGSLDLYALIRVCRRGLVPGAGADVRNSGGTSYAQGCSYDDSTSLSTSRRRSSHFSRAPRENGQYERIGTIRDCKSVNAGSSAVLVASTRSNLAVHGRCFAGDMY